MKTTEVLAFFAISFFVGFTEGVRRVFRAMDGAESDGAFGYRWNNPHLQRVCRVLAAIEASLLGVFIAMLVTR